MDPLTEEDKIVDPIIEDEDTVMNPLTEVDLAVGLWWQESAQVTVGQPEGGHHL